MRVAEEDVPDVPAICNQSPELLLVAQSHLVLMGGIHFEWRMMHEQENGGVRRFVQLPFEPRQPLVAKPAGDLGIDGVEEDKAVRSDVERRLHEAELVARMV